ncbi:hypothetical protein ABEV55_18220 [Aneurinibacillus thermoaerophilus]|nr:hypothetical protein [Aneurinibacillus thermoaerophilus]
MANASLAAVESMKKNWFGGQMKVCCMTDAIASGSTLLILQSKRLQGNQK